MTIKNQRKSREYAMQFLYALHVSGHDGLEISMLKETLVKELKLESFLLKYGEDLIFSVQKNQHILEKAIVGYAQEINFSARPLLEKFILLVASAELYYHRDVPVKVVITEAVQLAKKYSSEKSFRFVNGILNSLSQDLES